MLYQIFLQGMEACHYLGSSIAYQTGNLFAICDYAQKKNIFSLNTFIKRFSVSPSQQTIAVVHEFKGEQLVSLIETRKKKVSIGKTYKVKNS